MFINFDNRGDLYVSTFSPGVTSLNYNITSNIYRINVRTNPMQMTKVMGGGDSYGAGASPSSIRVLNGTFNFDEDNYLYYYTSCDPATGTNVVNLNLAIRLMRVLIDQATGAIGNSEIVAGNCTIGTITNGTLAINSPIQPGTQIYGAHLAGVTAWDHADKIVIGLYSSAYKIIAGKIYATNLPLNYPYNVAKSPTSAVLYISSSTSISECNFNIAGANGDTCSLYINNAGAGAACRNDGTHKSASCIKTTHAPLFSSTGIMYFADDMVGNSNRYYQIRYLDQAGNLQTLMGTKAFAGNGLDRSLIRGSFSGIRYKQSTESNQGAFPEGLYFNENTGIVFGYLNPTNGLTSVLWGDQSQNIAAINGEVISSSKSMGLSYTGGNAYGINFDSDGLPILRVDHAVVRVKSDQTIEYLTSTNASNPAYSKANGTLGSGLSTYIFGTAHNITLDDDGIFIMSGPSVAGGSYYVMSYYETNNSVSGALTHKMNEARVVNIGGNSADITTPGLAKNATINSICYHSTYCFSRYDSSNDILYYTQGDNKIRSFNFPKDTANSTLTTLLTVSTPTVDDSLGEKVTNFIFLQDNNRVFFLVKNCVDSIGSTCYKYINGFHCLYTSAVGSPKAWCDGRDLLPSSGPLYGVVGTGADQFSWEDNNNLFISTYNGLILKYQLPP
jgi:hypothetical protein